MIADGLPPGDRPNARWVCNAPGCRAEIGEIRAIFHTMFARRDGFSTNLDRLAGLFPDSVYARAVERFCRATVRGVSLPRSRAFVRTETDVSIYPGSRPLG